MIESEKQGRKPGYQARIQQLEIVRQEAEVRATMLAKDYSPWKEHNAAVRSVVVSVQANPDTEGIWSGLGSRLKDRARTFFGLTS
mmetsp:Transcript_63702/g.118361  ORF Transcript_63702/g.118361 Transcript_63702/m.118361 type:complete len:85 (+) Transcript_63702:443-697(+)